ncbi:hypothetical protein NGM44_02740 [Moraxella sp. FZFQ2102]|uniref:hypothetical protein n=1 Tax=Moraxella sp. FZFQ2102 TaxID=2953752 RepID=UPI00209BEB1D|nr:hypothetical protein [Moraxella sp. FZFQ2102]USZ15326.1 hypothetical protein NGM44_02740 [Moraxella sp. FZFQ2102]
MALNLIIKNYRSIARHAQKPTVLAEMAAESVSIGKFYMSFVTVFPKKMKNQWIVFVNCCKPFYLVQKSVTIYRRCADVSRQKGNKGNDA